MQWYLTSLISEGMKPPSLVRFVYGESLDQSVLNPFTSPSRLQFVRMKVYNDDLGVEAVALALWIPIRA